MKAFFFPVLFLVSISTFSQEVRDSIGVHGGVEVQAEYPGGLSAFLVSLSKTLEVSRMELDEMDRGCVKFLLSFVVLEDGSTSRISMKKRGQACDSCSREAECAMQQMKAWKPAMKNGKPVKCYYNFPIRIRIL